MNATDVTRLVLESLPAWAWKGAALLALAGAADAALRRRNPALRHLLWSSALLGVLVMPAADRLPAAWRLPLPSAVAELLPAPAGGASGAHEATNVAPTKTAQRGPGARAATDALPAAAPKAE